MENFYKTSIGRVKTLKSVSLALLLLLFLSVDVGAAYAQSASAQGTVATGKRRITGTVTDADGAPLVGATVYIQNTNVGTTTNTDGLFVIDVQPKQQITVSYIGYLSQTLPTDGREVINVKLLTDTDQIEEGVVVGFGKQRRQATVYELSWAREYMDLFVPCNNGYNVIISKKGNMLIRHVAGGDIVSIPKASITNRQAFDKYLNKCQHEKEEQKKRIQRELEKQKERIRLENEAREKEIKIRDVLRNELKAAVSETNRNKEVTKFTPIFGEVNADASVSRLKYNIFAEIKVTLFLMHKSTVIGRLVEATRNISTLADDNELNTAFLKKKIMSVAKSPVQDMSITPDGAMHIYEMACKYLKKQKDMKVDENLWMAANESKRQVLRLVYAVSSRKMQTPDCYVGDFLNSKFKNGCTCFVLNNYSFAYDIANDSVTMDEQQKAELCLLVKRLNAQKKTIKICQKTIESLQQAEGLQDDLNMSYALKDENIVIRGKHCLGKLIIAPCEKITGTEIKKWL